MSFDELAAQVDVNNSDLDDIYPAWEKLKVLKNVRKSNESERMASPVPTKKIKIDVQKPQQKQQRKHTNEVAVAANTTNKSTIDNGAKMEVKSFWVACCGWGGSRKSGRKMEKSNILKPSASVSQISEMTAGLKQEYTGNI